MPDEVGTRQLLYFVTLTEELHFGRAAVRLGITQPALSQQIAALEETIGCPLFSRRPLVALTPAGTVFRDEAREALLQIEHGVAATQRVARGEVGPLSIGFAASAVLTGLPEIIRRYRSKWPDVTLDLRELSAAAERSAVRLGELDLAFVREMEPQPGIEYEMALSESLGVLLPPRHPLASKRRITARTLEEESFVHFPREIAPTLYDQIMEVCRDAGFIPRVVQDVYEWLTLISLVQAGFGVALVPSSFRKLSWGGVCYRPLAGSAPRPTIALCYRPDRISPVAAAFVTFTREIAAEGTGASWEAAAKEA